MDSVPYHFIDEPIEVIFEKPPLLEKSPTCPDAFTWQGELFTIKTVLAEWSDFSRRGRMANNMRPAHASRAAIKGSWGVGRFYFQVRVDDNRIFEIYYDRAPAGADDRKGAWFIKGERLEK